MCRAVVAAGGGGSGGGGSGGGGGGVGGVRVRRDGLPGGRVRVVPGVAHGRLDGARKVAEEGAWRRGVVAGWTHGGCRL